MGVQDVKEHSCFFQAEDGIRVDLVTGVQTCALPIWSFPNLINSDLNDLNKDLKNIFSLKDKYKTWNELKKDLNNKKQDKRFRIKSKILKDWIGQETHTMLFSDWLDKNFDPVQNGFMLTDNLAKIPKNKEVWFSGKAVFISREIWSDYSFKESLRGLL